MTDTHSYGLFPVSKNAHSPLPSRIADTGSKMFISMKDKSGVDRDRSANHLFCEQAEPSGRLGFGDLNSDMAEKGVQPPGCTLPYGSQEACEKILQ